MLVVSRGAAGRVAICVLGVRVVGRGSVVSSWCAACIRSFDMQQHEVWTSREELVPHWREIFSWAYPTHKSRRPPGPSDGQCLTGTLRGVVGLLTLVEHLWAPSMRGYGRGLAISCWARGGIVIT